MLFSIGLLIVIAFLAYKASPVEKEESAHIHGAGQIGLLAAIALFGVDYFTSYFYATGEMMHALHPYGIQEWGYVAAAIISVANIVFGFLYMYSLGIFNEGGGSYTASMRYITPGLSLVVAVVLIQDYIFTIVVSSLSGGDQLLSVLGLYGTNWFWHFLIGGALAAITWYLTIRGRGESAQIVFTLLGIFVLMTLLMVGGLIYANVRGVAAVEVEETIKQVSFGQALFHLLTASMKGLVALTGLEAMSNGIQFVINEDANIVKWGRKHMPKLKGLWDFYSGKAGIGRFVQTSFLFYGGLTTFMLTFFAIRFNVFDGTLGRTLVGNLAYIGFTQFPGGEIMFWVYQILAVALLSAASMTAFQDLQATEWRDVAIGELPEFIVYRNEQGTFTRSVTIGFAATIIIMLLVRGQTSVAVPFYGVGVFMPIMVMGLAIRRHVLEHYTGKKRAWGAFAASVAAALAAIVFVGQIAGKWQEGGWMVLISFAVLVLAANAMLISPIGFRDPKQIHRIVRDKARVQGAMASIVEWQSLRMQEYRYTVLMGVTKFFELFGVRRPVRFDPPVEAGDYDHALHVDHPEAPSLLEQYLEKPQPRVGGSPKQTEPVPHDAM
ncbi:Potassium transporter KimA [Planctomycetaceae bacterium]|nr:Potassium transporter KimA [Planctomycetaceae bacterium]